MSETQPSQTANPPPRPTPNLDGAERAKKLTMTRVWGKLTPMKADDEKRWVADFYCYVTGFKEEDSEYGEYFRWLGEFRSINLLTGEVLKSANAIFPPIASDVIHAAYVGANKGNANDGNVMLAFRIGTEPDYTAEGMPANKTGYRYILVDIVAPSHKSPLDLLYEDVHRPMIGHDPGGQRLTDQSADPDVQEAAGRGGKGNKKAA